LSQAASRRVEVSPAALGSLALHVAVAAAFMITWGSRDLKVGSVVPVTIVSSAPDTDTRPAEQGPQTQTAMTETPVLEAPPEPAPPPPQPVPPTPTPKAAKPVEKAPAPLAKAPAKPAEKSLDLDALAASLTKPTRNAPQRPSAAPKGPTRAETAPVARQTVGAGLAAGSALQGLAEELQRRWNPNCEVEGGRDVVVRVTFQLGVGGQVVGDVGSQIQGPRTPVAQAAADRAVRAVYAAAPFRGLPREFYGDRIAVNFNAREACAR
jgi:periplasmic protein TonB